ncbi:hypothetical protein ACS0TY_031202 [Phlomoides rotata]
MLKTTQDGEKNTQCCTKDMGPNLKKLKTGVFTRTRLNTNSPSSRTTPLAGASSRLGDIPYMEVASTLKNPSTIPIAGASSRSTDIPHMEAAGASTNPSTTPTDGTSSRSSDIPHMEDDGTSTNPCTTPADGAFLQIEDAPHIEQVGLIVMVRRKEKLVLEGPILRKRALTRMMRAIFFSLQSKETLELA